ncbi:phenylalanine--tRNA ligase subunit beta [Roseomonas aerophila]|uniref:Phenylalanine--tRNA ligase beta subunit n=1 Tax=Teichococcus aerophilus TaxID=1224513 RepID=A0ABR7RUE1_9PROT|nr:phenylalanine--tRNA ligase subunit beta [Pseudoroseomonas aerophila]MBC9209988.1 phenylalanine--tRNA ligase subunit beta [Pseudoroseomonas aerophila]
MKFSLSWLKRHLETDATLEQISTTLSAIGLEVEGIEDRGAALAPFRIAHVIEAVQHPDADKLRVCQVDIADGTIRTIVCGAPNARTGMKTVLGLPGAVVPANGMVLKVGKIRGVESQGMMCSSRELGLGDEHDGIIDLPADAPVGQPYASWAGLDDPVIEISVTPNRGDALSVRGVARDLAAAGLGTLKPFAPAPVQAAYPSPLAWSVDDLAGCPWVLGRAVRGVKNGPSPKWLQDKLVSIGLRPINALVDVTNWFTYDLGRPLHVFDVAKVKGDTLVIRRGREGESYLALNGKEISVTRDDLVIADDGGVESLAGIMGGEHSGSDLGTTEVFIECALFDPVQIALSGRRHELRSDARQRFERGVDQALPPAALEAATALIIELCGGEASEITAAGAEPQWQRTAHLRFERIAGLGGSSITPDEAVEGLERLGFSVASRDEAGVTVNVPSWRNDVAGGQGGLAQSPELAPERAAKAAEGCAAIEPECDLLEEVLRLRGLDAVPPVSLPVPSPVPQSSLTARQTRTSLARRVLAARGMLDCVSFGFLDDKTAALFGDTPASLRLENPIAADLNQMRPTPLASIALAAARNIARGYPDVALAEIGGAYRDITPAGQLTVAAGLRTGFTPRHWSEPARAVDAMDAKGDALAVLASLGVPTAALSVAAEAPGFYHPGRSGVIKQGPKTVLATFGELHPTLRGQLDLPGPAVAFEVFLDLVADPKKRKKAVPDLPAFQPLKRDFAFLVDATVPAENLVRAARGAERALITDVALFDRYAGERLPEGKVSLALEVTLQPRDASLTDAEIEAVGAKIVAAVTKATGATLRG